MHLTALSQFGNGTKKVTWSHYGNQANIQFVLVHQPLCVTAWRGHTSVLYVGQPAEGFLGQNAHASVAVDHEFLQIVLKNAKVKQYLSSWVKRNSWLSPACSGVSYSLFLAFPCFSALSADNWRIWSWSRWHFCRNCHSSRWCWWSFLFTGYISTELAVGWPPATASSRPTVEHTRPLRFFSEKPVFVLVAYWRVVFAELSGKSGMNGKFLRSFITCWSF